jgi:hypothetical protein
MTEQKQKPLPTLFTKDQLYMDDHWGCGYFAGHGTDVWW